MASTEKSIFNMNKIAPHFPTSTQNIYHFIFIYLGSGDCMIKELIITILHIWFISYL